MATPWVADYVNRIPPAALKAAGVVGVCRYLASSSGIGKIIGLAEYRELVGAGIQVVLNWEQAATDWLDGAAGGKADGTKAAQLAHALGYPAGRPIPGSADFDMSAAQWSAHGRAYAIAYRDALHAGGYAAGVYGGWDVLSWCRDLGGYVMFWQSMSTGFSGGRNKNPFPGGHLLQHAAAASVGGHEVDRNDIRRPDWAGPTAEDDMALSAADIEYQLEHVPRVTISGGRVTNAGDRDLNTAAASLAAQALVALQGQTDAVAQRVAAVEARPAEPVTDDQVIAAVEAKLADQAFVERLAAALASHIHVQ